MLLLSIDKCYYDQVTPRCFIIKDVMCAGCHEELRSRGACVFVNVNDIVFIFSNEGIFMLHCIDYC